MAKLLNKKEVAERTRFSVSTISHWVSDERIPFLKIKRAVRFDEEVIEKWIKAGGPSSQKAGVNENN